MKSTFDLLSPKDKALLLDLYESENYGALKRLLEAERLELAKTALTVPKERLDNIQGQAYSLKQLHLTLKDGYKRKLETEKQSKG